MKVKTTENDYIYASARVRALELGLCSKENIMRMIEAKTIEDVYQLMSESGLTLIYDKDGKVLEEELLDKLLCQAYQDVFAMLPEDGTLGYLLYPYDACNIKTAYKCHVRGIQCKDMLHLCASVSPDKVEQAFSEQDFSKFPSHMAKATENLEEVYAKTRDPRQIDWLLDKASYQDMQDAVKNEPFLADLLCVRIDTTNIISMFRLFAMPNIEQARVMLPEVIIAGGRYPLADFKIWFDEGEKAFREKMSFGQYADILSEQGEGIRIGLLERVADDFYANVLVKSRYMAFGAPVLVTYLSAWETECKNLRIILAGKRAGQSSDAIREQVRFGFLGL